MKYIEVAKINVNEARLAISYSPQTGQLRWMASKKASVNGAVINTKDKDGYLSLKYLGVRYRAHRFAWFLFYGEFPSGYVDHINGDKADNRISNLRIANNSENNCNRPASCRNKLGAKGVRKHGNKFQALICKDKKQVFLGSFDTKELAIECYMKAAKQLHGAFAYEQVR